MAIEIGEMVVRASTGPALQAETGPQNPNPGLNGQDRAPVAGTGAPEDVERLKKVLLAEVREMILEILADREER